MSEALPVTFPCPACGFVVFSEPSGSYDVCPVCGWEDDHVQLLHVDSRIGANKESLRQAQALALHKVPIATSVLTSYHRDPSWRPLATGEIPGAISGPPRNGLAYFEAAGGESPAYYWRPRLNRPPST